MAMAKAAINSTGKGSTKTMIGMDARNKIPGNLCGASRKRPAFLQDKLTNNHSCTILCTIIKLRKYIMDALSYSAARADLAATMEKVCRDHDPVIITKKRDSAVVMISLEDFEAMQETAYLMQSPANARRLLKSIDEMKRGKGGKEIRQRAGTVGRCLTSALRQLPGWIIVTGRLRTVKLSSG